MPKKAKKQKQDSPRMLKIVYFDEGSALDFLDIYQGGRLTETETSTRSTKKGAEAAGKVTVGTGSLFRAISSLVKAEADLSAGGHLSKLGEEAIRTEISNSLIADFLEIADSTDSLEKISGIPLQAPPESMTYMKMYTPYFKVLKMEQEPINIAELDAALEKAKGYYELLGHKESLPIILRFNISAFRNNYQLNDLTRMNLVSYAVAVGTFPLEKLIAKNELSPDETISRPTAQQIFDGSGEHSTQSSSGRSAPLYDVILSGVAS